MTITVVEGFDALSASVTQTAYPLGNFFGADMIAGRFGGQAFRPGPGNQNGSFKLGPGASTQCAVGVALLLTSLQFSGLGTGVAIIRFLDSGGSRQASLQVANDGSVKATSGVSTILGTSAAGVVSPDVFNYFEIEYVLSDTVGVFKVWINGVQVLNLTNVDTKGQSSTSYTEVEFNAAGCGNGGLALDDIYYSTVATRLGECRVETLRPSADTADKDWTPNSGTTNFSRVNESVTDGDTTYLSSSTVGARDLFALNDLTGVPTTIHAVCPVLIARKDDATSRALAIVTDSGGTITVGPNKAMTGAYARFSDVLEVDPDTGSPWDYLAVNALLLGVEVTI